MLAVQGFRFPTVDNLNPGVVTIHPAKAQIDHDMPGNHTDIFKQDACLLELFFQRVAVVGIARETARPNDQPLLVRDRNAGFDAKFVGLSGLALADAFHLRGVERIQLVLVFRLLGAESLCAFQQGSQLSKRLGVLDSGRSQLALDFTQYDAQNGPLPLEHPFESPKLLGVGVATGLAAQFLSFLDEGLLERDANGSSRLDSLGPRNVQQTAVDRMGDGLSCTVVSTITRSNSAGQMAFIWTAASIVALSNSSTPASPIALRKRPICVASQGSFGV